MLNFYHRLALKLHRLRHVLWLLAAASLAGFVLMLFDVAGPQAEPYLLPLVLLFAWLLAAISVAYGFAPPLPVAPPGASWWARTKVVLMRSYLWTMAMVMSLVSVAVGVLSVRAASLLIIG